MMIKKDIKTLSEFKNPTPEPRWRLHLDDGSHIDVTGTAERNATLLRLLRDGRITAQGVNDIHNLRIQALRGVENITVNMTINRTEEVEEKTSVWKLFKEDVGGWDWNTFFTRMGLSSVAALLIVLLQYLTSGPIKVDNEVVPFVKVLPFTIGLTWSMSITAWSLWKTWVILPYISCWVKMVFFILVFIICGLTVGLINTSVEDRIMNFIGKHSMTDKEIKILKTVLP